MTTQEQFETILNCCTTQEELQIIKEIIIDYLAPQATY